MHPLQEKIAPHPAANVSSIVILNSFSALLSSLTSSNSIFNN